MRIFDKNFAKLQREALEENENSGWEDTISNEKIDLI